MAEYTPDNWVIVRFKSKTDLHYRIMSRWNSGNRWTSDRWRLSSGITRYTFDGDYWYFYGTTGDCYKCYIDNYGLKMDSDGIWKQLKHLRIDEVGSFVVDAEVELLEDQEWNKKDWDWILK